MLTLLHTFSNSDLRGFSIYVRNDSPVHFPADPARHDMGVTFCVSLVAFCAIKAEAASISGTVTDVHGNPVNANITLYKQGQGDEWLFYIDFKASSLDGRYSFSGLLPGNYRLGFFSNTFVPEFYNDKVSLKQADTLSLVEGVIH